MCKEPLFKGAATAMITPFDVQGIDYAAFENMIDIQLASGISALVVAGTTGEGSTLTREERRKLTRIASEKLQKKIPLIIGAGSNDTSRAVALARDAALSGADALLLVTPYYNKCTQQGLIEHYKRISESSGLPFIAYSVPSRTGMAITPETAAKIAELPLAYGIKDAGSNIAETAKMIALCGEELPLYSGNDDRIVPVLSLGGKGVISVVSNILPGDICRLCDLFESGDVRSAAALQTKLFPLIEALFCEVNPIPIKAAMADMRLCRNILRSPLTPLTDENKTKLMTMLPANQFLKAER